MNEEKQNGGKIMPKKRGQQKVDGKDDDWETVGWLNETSSETVLTISTSDGELFGFINLKSFDKFVDGKITGVPIKKPTKPKE